MIAALAGAASARPAPPSTRPLAWLPHASRMGEHPGRAARVHLLAPTMLDRRSRAAA
jgi:hypothetical protein